ncbi:hypothetical protein FBZ89_106269 [Nitrospirillum amazonense]|uniref:Cysteine rich repeat protein n=1 Tax=Nitrospirillum amazonense TaxID=28077 RepID=A0A560FGY2_9PROT|nr:hypothetical protein [Nitrospirillum amazonense]TWB20865.1 hypothetical protein FBZ89_106269 [Nitrospirillum amazonense]
MFAPLKNSSRKVAVAAAALSFLALSAPLSANAAGTEVVVTPAVSQACQAMGLHPANSDFAACVNVLTHVKGAHAQVSAQVGREQQACAAAGATPGSADFNACVDNLDAALTAQALSAN